MEHERLDKEIVEHKEKVKLENESKLAQAKLMISKELSEKFEKDKYCYF